MSLAHDSVRYDTSVSLVSRGLALFLVVTSLPVLGLIAYLTVVENDPLWVVALAAVLLFGPLLFLTKLRLHVELTDDELRYWVRPWHRRPRTLSLDTVTTVEPLFRRPRNRLTLRRVNLGRGWIDWNGEEVRYVLSGDSGLRISREEGRDLLLWFEEAEELTRALDDTRRR